MIRHIVMFRFFDEADGRKKAENLLIAKKMLEELQGVVPTLASSRVTLGAQGQNGTNYDIVLEADFETLKGLNEYIVHPAHKKVGEFMAKVRELRACIDYEL